MRSLKTPAGSILVWTIALGMIMTSVFLFMAIRLNRNSTLSRETLDFVQQQAYLQSYVDYVKQLEPSEWRTLKAQGIDYGGITGTLTNEVEEIKGFLDHGQSVTLPLNSHLVVEWNECLQGILKENGVLESNPPFNKPGPAPSCGKSIGVNYDRLGLINGVNSTFTLTSTGEPTHYRISSSGPFEANEWTLNLEVKLQSGQVIRVKETWKGV